MSAQQHYQPHQHDGTYIPTRSSQQSKWLAQLSPSYAPTAAATSSLRIPTTSSTTTLLHPQHPPSSTLSSTRHGHDHGHVQQYAPTVSSSLTTREQQLQPAQVEASDLQQRLDEVTHQHQHPSLILLSSVLIGE
jgi:hypothetical protein